MKEFIALLGKPRAVMMLVPAGDPVDSVIKDLLPHLDKGDLLITLTLASATSKLKACAPTRWAKGHSNPSGTVLEKPIDPGENYKAGERVAARRADHSSYFNRMTDYALDNSPVFKLCSGL
jgi:6-phosphogluconate dehydrogenase-like protein